MSERYSRVFTLSDRLYAEGSPLIVLAGALLKDQETGKILAQLKFQNIDSRKILALKVKVSSFDTFGNPIDDQKDFQYLDLNAKQNTSFGQKTPIPLNVSARSFTAAVSEVAFADGSTWQSAAQKEWEPLSEAIALENVVPDDELRKQYRMKFGEDCNYLPQQVKDLWFCACGNIQHTSDTHCTSCGKDSVVLFAADFDLLKQERDQRLAAEQAKKEADAAAAEAKRKKAKKLTLILSAIIVLVAVGALLAYQLISRNPNSNIYKYNAAVQAMEVSVGRAGEQIAALPDDYKESATLKNIYNTYLPYCGDFIWATDTTQDDTSFSSDFSYQDGNLYWVYSGYPLNVEDEHFYFDEPTLVSDASVEEIYYLNGSIGLMLKAQFADDRIALVMEQVSAGMEGVPSELVTFYSMTVEETKAAYDDMNRRNDEAMELAKNGELDAAAEVFVELTDTYGVLAAKVCDHGYYQLAHNALNAGLLDKTDLFLEKITDSTRFDDMDEFNTQRDYLMFYQEGMNREINSKSDAEYVADMIEKLPENYPNIEELQKKIDTYEAEQKQAATAKQETSKAQSGNVNVPTKAPSNTPVELTTQSLAGTWKRRNAPDGTMDGDYTFSGNSFSYKTYDEQGVWATFNGTYYIKDANTIAMEGSFSLRSYSPGYQEAKSFEWRNIVLTESNLTYDWASYSKAFGWSVDDPETLVK